MGDLFVKGLEFITKTLIHEVKARRPELPEPERPEAAPLSHTAPWASAPSAAPHAALDMPTTAETVEELRRRLGKELYRLELDLQGGGRIAGKPCDCLSAKHHLGLEATAEELMPMDPRPVYGKIIRWLREHQAEFEPAAIAQRPPEYYQQLSAEPRAFRKEVMGTEKLVALLNEDERREVAERAREIAEKNQEVGHES